MTFQSLDITSGIMRRVSSTSSETHARMITVDKRTYFSLFACHFFSIAHRFILLLQVEARESAQGKLNASYRGSDDFSTRRITLITDPAVENS